MASPSASTIDATIKLPQIAPQDPFVKVVKALAAFFVDEIQSPATFDQLRTAPAGNKIRAFVNYLVSHVSNKAIVNALLTLKWHFSTLEMDDRKLNETRANACEIVAWRFLSKLSERDAMNFCLYDLPQQTPVEAVEAGRWREEATERSNLLPQFRARDHDVPSRPGTSSQRMNLLRSVSHMGYIFSSGEDVAEDEEDPTSSFTGLNALEIAAVADCKKFLSQGVVQKIITSIWKGDIIFWETLSTTTKKRAQFYSECRPDPFTRLRVPRYIKAFEVLFFATFLALYYAVLVQRNPNRITPVEIVLYIWFAAFTYEELGEFIDAGSIFYVVDIWNGCDLLIILIGVAFLVTRIFGLAKDNTGVIDASFDILSLEALFMVPRICSLLSLHPYFGTLIPCLKAMVKDFVKFMVVVAILYIGFLTTFTLLARDTFTLSEMSWILIKVFFGSSYIGFDIMNQISPHLGPPLMLIFVTMTNILLITSLISILSDSFSKVISRAREEYLFVYSIYVLEASTSNRLTHFYPPLNLIPLIFIRPLRLFVSSEKLRKTRIGLLKYTHFPIVGIIMFYESIQERLTTLDASLSTAWGSRESQSQVGKPSPFLSKRAATNSSQHLLEAGTEGEVSDLDHEHTARQSNNTRPATAHVDIIVVHKKIDALTEKLDALTALFMAQQNFSSGSPDDGQL